MIQDEDVDTASSDALGEGLMGLLRPAVEEVDERVRSVRYVMTPGNIAHYQ